MAGTLGFNSYGKSRVRVTRLVRGDGRHGFSDRSVDIQCTGDFDTAHTEGDNSQILPTDTMKNTVYALAKLGAPDDRVEPAEAFARRIVRHLIETQPQIDSVHVEIVEQRWRRLDVDGAPHPHAFVLSGEGQRWCSLTGDEDGYTVSAGVRGLVVLKTTDSAFTGFVRDRFTTLPDAEDRIMATSMDAEWEYDLSEGDDVDFDALWEDARDALVEAFATHRSESVQQTGLAMGQAALARVPQLTQVELSLPNKHFLPVDLARFDLPADNDVFQPVDEPHGQINLVVQRDADGAHDQDN